MESIIDLSTVITVSEDAIASDIDGEIVLINVTNGRYYGLDQIASEIWRRLQAPISVEALCGQLKDACEGDPATIERETLAFASTLAERGLVRSVDSTG